jgi:hypothetical protein
MGLSVYRDQPLSEFIATQNGPAHQCRQRRYNRKP